MFKVKLFKGTDFFRRFSHTPRGAVVNQKVKADLRSFPHAWTNLSQMALCHTKEKPWPWCVKFINIQSCRFSHTEKYSWNWYVRLTPIKPRNYLREDKQNHRSKLEGPLWPSIFTNVMPQKMAGKLCLRGTDQTQLWEREKVEITSEKERSIIKILHRVSQRCVCSIFRRVKIMYSFDELISIAH